MARLAVRLLAGMALVVLPAIALGIVAGIGGFTFVYASGASYLTDDPEACVNCHVMRTEYEGWLRSSHRSVATCNDCHTPPGLLDHWVVKARNGWHHSLAFTTQDFAEPIRIGAYNAAVTEAQCRQCHGELVADLDALGVDAHGERPPGDAVSCARCHGSVGHAHAF